MTLKEYSTPVVRILNPWQVMLYLSHGLKPIDIYVSGDNKSDAKIVYVFDRDKSHELFVRFRNHTLDFGVNVVSNKNEMISR